MRVLTEDIKALLDQAILRFEKETKTKLSETNNAIFFEKFTKYLNRLTCYKLNDATVYKQVYIRLRNLTSGEVGLSRDYLNAFCQFAHKKDYTEVYTMVMDSDAEIPEFPYPPYIPCFPATPAVRIDIPNFKDVWIKDESFNPTGTHKDRLAWEIYLFYHDLIKKQFEIGGRIDIPRLSMISSGTAAISIQYLLRRYGLPSLKVIMDTNTADEYINLVTKIGCEVYLHNLSKKKLTSKEILEITKNESGTEITYGHSIDDIKQTFYDWLSYEVLNLNPQNLFIPYGSGDLCSNIVNICIGELKSRRSSKRFFGNKNILSKCNFFGAATSNRKTKMVMLYAPHNSYKEHDLSYLKNGHIGNGSGVVEVEERYVNDAMRVAKENRITCDPSGAAGLALFLQMKHKLNPNEKHVIINTGKVKANLFSE